MVQFSHQSCMSGEIIFQNEEELRHVKTKFCTELILIVQTKSLTNDIEVMTKIISFRCYFFVGTPSNMQLFQCSLSIISLKRQEKRFRRMKTKSSLRFSQNILFDQKFQLGPTKSWILKNHWQIIAHIFGVYPDVFTFQPFIILQFYTREICDYQLILLLTLSLVISKQTHYGLIT